MPRIAIATVNRECSACGMPATAGRYCHECGDSPVRPEVTINGSVSAREYSEPRGGQVNG